MPLGTDAIYLFMAVMLHATTRNLNCFANNQIWHILKPHLHCELSLKVSHEATDMLNLGTGHKVKEVGRAGKIIYLVSAILVAHPLIAVRKFVAHLKLVLKNYDPPIQKGERYQRSIFLLPNNSVLS